jgi:hypothetical protein
MRAQTVQTRDNRASRRVGSGSDRSVIRGGHGAPERSYGPLDSSRLRRDGPAGLRPSRVPVSQPSEPDELHADRVASEVEPGGGAGYGVARSPHGWAPSVVWSALSSAPRRVSSDERPRGLAVDFSAVQVHDGPEAHAASRALAAAAFTVGDHVVLGEGYDGGSAIGRRLLVHELAHVAQHQRQPGNLTVHRQGAQTTSPAGTTYVAPRQDHAMVLPTDVIKIAVREGMNGPELAAYTGPRRVGADGLLIFTDARGSFTVAVGGLEVGFAARAIADRFVDAGRLDDPQVSVTSADGWAAGGAGSLRGGIRGKKAPFESYISSVNDPIDAVVRYREWLNKVTDPQQLDAITPPELWAMALKKPAGPARDPRDVHIEEFLDFIHHQQDLDRAETDPKERSRRARTMSRFLDWLDGHREAKGFLRARPAVVYADISVQVLKEDVNAQVKADVAAQHEAAERKWVDDPELNKQRQAKWSQYYQLAMQLWGYSSRAYPYLIQLPSEGRDILVTGDPALQAVLNDLARDLLQWATDHTFDSDYTSRDARSVLLDLRTRGDYPRRFSVASRQPLAHESMARHDLLWGRVFASFGESVGSGLLAIAVVGLFVGAEVITAGQATWILVGVAGASGVSSYLDRRTEIEQKGYDVPIPETIIHSAGDVIGVSQLVEGITGQRLGTEEELGSIARSDSLGTGAGNVTTLLIGSKAYRQGQSLGVKFRVPEAGTLPSGPNANVRDVKAPDAKMPATPTPSASAGPVERSMRASLPDNLKLGFDKWMAETRTRGGDPETVLAGKSPRSVESVSEGYVRRHAGEVARAEEAAYLRERSADNPLRPILKNVRQVGDNVWIHYEATPPAAAEVAHAQVIAAETGQPVHLFGDTASKISYPGIDGTIGNPPRPLSLKSHSTGAIANSARFAAQEALIKAKTHGYSQVEVDISMPGKTVAEVKAAWDVKPDIEGAHDLGPYYEGTTIAKITVRCSDGIWAPPKGPAQTGVPPPLPHQRRDDNPR